MEFNFWQFVYGQPYVGEAVPDSKKSEAAYAASEQCRCALEQELDEPLKQKLEELMDLQSELECCHGTDMFCAGVAMALQAAVQLFAGEDT